MPVASENPPVPSALADMASDRDEDSSVHSRASSIRSVASRISDTATAAIGRSKRVIVKTAKAAALRLEDLTTKRAPKKLKVSDCEYLLYLV